MSEDDRLQQHCRVWLYVIAMLHLFCLGLLHRPAPEFPHAESHYALRLVADTPAPPPPGPHRI